MHALLRMLLQLRILVSVLSFRLLLLAKHDQEHSLSLPRTPADPNVGDLPLLPELLGSLLGRPGRNLQPLLLQLRAGLTVLPRRFLLLPQHGLEHHPSLPRRQASPHVEGLALPAELLGSLLGRPPGRPLQPLLLLASAARAPPVGNARVPRAAGDAAPVGKGPQQTPLHVQPLRQATAQPPERPAACGCRRRVGAAGAAAVAPATE
ncbi:unnamed protein product, partial [Prorocentrum cordatum]